MGEALVGTLPHAGTSENAIDFAFHLQAGRADVYERGAWKADNTAVAGDKLRIAVAGGVVTYSKNGSAVYTSAVVPAYPLQATASLVDAGAAVNDARMGLDKPSTGGGTFVAGLMATPAAAGNAATVSWTTSVPTDGQVEYGATTSYGLWSVYDAAVAASHSVTLVDLSPATTYHYRVRSEDGAGNVVFSADATRCRCFTNGSSR